VALELVADENESLLVDLEEGVMGRLYPELILDLGGGGKGECGDVGVVGEED
jgi:hypothetical protein